MYSGQEQRDSNTVSLRNFCYVWDRPDDQCYHLEAGLDDVDWLTVC